MTEDLGERAATGDEDPEHLERAHLAATLIRRSLPLTRATRLLEYGAGTGLLSVAPADDVGHPGFARRTLTTQLQAVGFGSVVFQDGPIVSEDDRDCPLFLCMAELPAP